MPGTSQSMQHPQPSRHPAAPIAAHHCNQGDKLHDLGPAVALSPSCSCCFTPKKAESAAGVTPLGSDFDLGLNHVQAQSGGGGARRQGAPWLMPLVPPSDLPCTTMIIPEAWRTPIRSSIHLGRSLSHLNPPPPSLRRLPAAPMAPQQPPTCHPAFACPHCRWPRRLAAQTATGRPPSPATCPPSTHSLLRECLDGWQWPGCGAGLC